jgi:hypothetical protein
LTALLELGVLPVPLRAAFTVIVAKEVTIQSTNKIVIAFLKPIISLQFLLLLLEHMKQKIKFNRLSDQIIDLDILMLKLLDFL